MPSSDAVYDLKAVSVRLRTPNGERQVLSGISLQIYKGEFVVIAGANGSGKTTLGRVLAGLCPISSGTIIKPAPWFASQMVWQYPQAQLVSDTVHEDVRFGPKNRFLESASMERMSLAALRAVGLEQMGQRDVLSLSGGEQQRLAVAGCIAVGPHVMIFDEATSSLSPRAQRNVLRLASRLRRTGMTVVWITHQLEESAVADRLIALKDGTVHFDGTCRDFFYGRQPDLKAPVDELCMAPPYAVQVARALASKGVTLQDQPMTPKQLTKAVRRLCPST